MFSYILYTELINNLKFNCKFNFVTTPLRRDKSLRGGEVAIFYFDNVTNLFSEKAEYLITVNFLILVPKKKKKKF